MRISRFWYEKLPTLYLVAALIVLLVFGTNGLISALALLAAAALTRWWRIGKYERLKIDEEGRRQRLARRNTRTSDVNRSA